MNNRTECSFMLYHLTFATVFQGHFSIIQKWNGHGNKRKPKGSTKG